MYGLAVWVDDQLQSIAQSVPTYIKNSYSLKQELLALNLRAGHKYWIGTADAVNMYGNIPLKDMHKYISKYLRDNRDNFNIPTEAVLEALALVMSNNVFTFGDMFFKQRNGVPMGAPPAVVIAVLYYYLAAEIRLLQRFRDRLV